MCPRIGQEHNHQYDVLPQIFEVRDKFMEEEETITTNLEKAIEQRLASLTEAQFP
ncbi:MAG: hypothetical protein WBF43_10095 [Methylocella sp.]